MSQDWCAKWMNTSGKLAIIRLPKPNKSASKVWPAEFRDCRVSRESRSLETNANPLAACGYKEAVPARVELHIDGPGKRVPNGMNQAKVQAPTMPPPGW